MKIHEDSRGHLTEIFRIDEDDYIPHMGYVSSTKPLIKRGMHLHKEQTDCFVFINPKKLTQTYFL